MGKKKNKGGNSGGVYNNNNNNNNNNNENKNSENSNNDNNNNNNNNNENSNNNNNNNNNKENNSNNNGGGGGLADYANIVLKVDHHCDGCAQRIRKNILSFPGVRIVKLEGENKVKVVAMKNVDAVKLKEKVEKHLMKKIELISPQPPKKDEQKDNKDTATDKPKELPMATVTLKIPYHCHGCSEKTYKVLSTYKGVYEVKVEKDKDQVTVKGKVDVKKMVEDIRSRLKKRTVEIVPDKKQQDKKEGGEKDADKKQDKPGGGGGGPDGSKGKIEYYSAGAIYGDYYGQGYGYGPYGYAPVNPVFDTQVFSEENPNACSIM